MKTQLSIVYVVMTQSVNSTSSIEGVFDSLQKAELRVNELPEDTDYSWTSIYQQEVK